MNKFIYLLVTVFCTLGLNASEETKISTDPMQEIKDLIAAEERQMKGETTFKDEVLMRIYLSPAIKRLQEEIVFKSSIDTKSPSYVPVANGALMMLHATSTALDIYSVRNCSDDLSKFSNEDFKAIFASNDFGSAYELKKKTLTTSDHTSTAKRTDYIKFIHALRASNCNDSEELQKYLETK